MPELMPMLLQEVRFSDKVFKEYEDYIWQEKENGVRVMLHIKDGKISAVRNRRNKPVFHLYPELKELEFEKTSAVVDGELVVFQNDKSVFYGGINQRNKLNKEGAQESFPVTFVAFDLIYLDGDIKIELDYEERYELLHRIFHQHSGKHFMIADNINNPKRYWKEAIVPDGREGFVIKDPRSPYVPSSRSDKWLKIKNYKITELVVEQIETNVKGVRVSGKAKIGSLVCEVDCQYGGIYDIKLGDKLPVEYLDIVGNKLIQPHKPRGWKNK